MSDNKSSKKSPQSLTKKELLQLTKPQLIQLCKRYNIKGVNGKKQEMIKVLLAINARESEANKPKSPKSTLSLSDRTDHLISGYIHDLLDKNRKESYDYPSIIKMLIQFTGNIFLKFDKCADKYLHCIQQDGMLLKRGGLSHKMDAMALDELTRKINKPRKGERRRLGRRKPNPWITPVCLFGNGSGFSKGITTWKIKKMKTKGYTKIRGKSYSGDVYGGSKDRFGVITNLKYFKKEQLSEKIIDQHIEPYTYCPYDFKHGKMIKMILNCEENELVFKINNTEKETYTIALEPNKIYYPAVMTRYDNTSYKLIPN